MLHFKKMIRWLQPNLFILGICIGFVLCSVAGFIVSQSTRFVHFNRFFRENQPESHFYPTINELLTTVRHDVSPHQILILVGGSSISRGVGQNPEEVWTKQLQKRLGNQFKVINFAVNGAGVTSYSGVAFRILREEYKKIIYVSNCEKYGDHPIDGVSPYTYLFWDAYYKKLLHPDDVEKKMIWQLRKSEMHAKREGLELHLMSYLDSFFYFKDLWNWFSYRLMFTVWNDFVFHAPFRPRFRYVENTLDLKAIKIQNEKLRFQEEVKAIHTNIDSLADLSKTPSQYKDDAFILVRKSFDEAFSPRFRSNILCFVVSDNPKHLAEIPEKLQKADEYIRKQTVSLLRELNYHAIGIGDDFSADDFYDGRHIAPSGGNKIAEKVAEEVKNMVALNGYSLGA